MIIQMALKGVADIDVEDAEWAMSAGIMCNWWRKVKVLPSVQIPQRLTERNLDWHQNHYDKPDPMEGNEPFGKHTPFISLTAGTIQRDAALKKNFLRSAFHTALKFATNTWTKDGCIFYCYVFVLGRKSVPHPAFSEELRELNVYTKFTSFHREGEITAKIAVPPTQIEKCEFYTIAKINSDLNSGHLPAPVHVIKNTLYESPEAISNIRRVLI